MQFKPFSVRNLAILTGFAFASTAFGIAPAHAADKSKKLKYGAIAAGVIGAYLLSKGKTVPAAAVAAGGYYAYKKSQDARNDDRYGYRNNGDRYGYNPDRNNSGDVYPDDNYDTQYRTSAALKPSKQPSKFDLSPYLR